MSFLDTVSCGLGGGLILMLVMSSLATSTPGTIKDKRSPENVGAKNLDFPRKPNFAITIEVSVPLAAVDAYEADPVRVPDRAGSDVINQYRRLVEIFAKGAGSWQPALTPSQDGNVVVSRHSILNRQDPAPKTVRYAVHWPSSFPVGAECRVTILPAAVFDASSCNRLTEIVVRSHRFSGYYVIKGAD